MRAEAKPAEQFNDQHRRCDSSDDNDVTCLAPASMKLIALQCCEGAISLRSSDRADFYTSDFHTLSVAVLLLRFFSWHAYGLCNTLLVM